MNLLFVWLSRLLWDSPIVSKNSPKHFFIRRPLTHLQTPSIPFHSNHSTVVSALWALVTLLICTFVRNNFKFKESTLLLTVFLLTIGSISTYCSRPRRYKASFLFLCNIIDLSLLHIIECGRLTNLITHSLPF